jgi:xanthine/CO dehydrogenase XdhC/CoxF family maturation factor
MIGSIKKRETVYAKLRADGVSEEKLARVHSPIGLEIGAETPAEIAVSILAQVVQVRALRRASIAAPPSPDGNERVAGEAQVLVESARD